MKSPEQPFHILGKIIDLPERHEVGAERREAGRRKYEEKKLSMGIDAVRKHVEGVSYRGITVGCCGIVDNPKVEGGYAYPSMHNFKPIQHEQHGWAKLCAEANVCNIGLQDGGEYFSGLVVSSQFVSKGQGEEEIPFGNQWIGLAFSVKVMS